MKLHVDQASDALHLLLADTEIIESEEVSPGVILDYDKDNRLVGIEILRISERGEAINLRELLFQSA